MSSSAHPARNPEQIASSAQGSRLKWTDELKERFANAVTQLGGPSNATPKNIVKAMGVEGIKLGHVKSYLQKYRKKQQQWQQSEEDSSGISEDDETESIATSTSSALASVPFNLDSLDKFSYGTSSSSIEELQNRYPAHEILRFQERINQNIREHRQDLDQLAASLGEDEDEDQLPVSPRIEEATECFRRFGL